MKVVRSGSMLIINHISDPHASELYLEIWNQLKKRGHEIRYITESSIIIKFLSGHDINVHNLRIPFEQHYERYRTMDLEALKRTGESNYSGISLDYLTKADLVLCDRPPEHRYRITLAYLDAWKEYLASTGPDLIASSDATEVVNVCYGELAEKMGIPVMYSNYACVFKKRMFWDRSIMINTWVNRSLIDQDMNEKDRGFVEEYIDNMISRKPMIGFEPRKPLNIDSIIRSKNFFVNCIIGEEQRSRYFNLIDSIRFGFYGLARRPVLKGYYIEPDLDVPFVLFPLHVPYDAQVTFRGSEFRDQAETARRIAEAMPDGYLLYVKPHPHSVGHFPFKWLKKLSKISSVRIIDPNFSAHTLVEHCKAVVTINSDVGWEALMYGKPVVVLARPFYSRLGYTIDVDDINKLNEYLRTALDQKPIPREKMIKLVNTVYGSTVAGSFFTPEWEFDSSEENVKDVVDGMIASYRKLYNRYHQASIQ